MHDKYLRHCDPTIPFHWFAKHVGEVMGMGLMLFTIRPMRLQPQTKIPHVGDSSVLNLAAHVLAEHEAILTAPFTEPWRWFVWVQWHALAVALAELCSRTEGPDVDRAWGVVDAAFTRYAELVADTERGMLWQPIEKLMKRAKHNREIAQMPVADLSVRDHTASFANMPTPAPGPAISSISPGINLKVENQSFGRESSASTPYNANYASMGIWNSGLLGPGSINSNTPSVSTVMDGYTPATGISEPGSLPTMDPTALNNANNPIIPMDMAWNNWEDFVGDVNLADFDFTDPTVTGFPQS